MPHELTLGDVYFSPLLPVVIFAFFATVITTIIFNKFRLVRFIYAPPYVFLSIMLIYIIVIDKFWIKF
ncbi:MAG: DUF1656 domain-containing protein [Campylobacterota bacterium]|nr:DUF1656 domain-containing protein [Campylobacterota bacterium]